MSRYLLIGTIIASLVAASAATYFKLDRDRALSQLDTAKQQLALERLAHEQTRSALEAVSNELAAAERRLADRARVREQILQAPSSDDGPVAPVLRRTLDSLRSLTPQPPDSAAPLQPDDLQVGPSAPNP